MIPNTMRPSTLLLVLTCFLLAGCWVRVCALPQEVRIGGLFESMETDTQNAFLRAVDAVNADRELLPHVQLVADPKPVSHYDSFLTAKTVCELLEAGVAGVFGPSSPSTSGHVQAMCDTMEMPHIQTLYDPYVKRETCSINLYPHPSTLADVLLRLVEVYEWKEFTILYEDEDSLVRLQNVLQMYDPKGYTVTVRQLPEIDMKPMFRKLLQEGVQNIVLDCQIDKLQNALQQAQQVGVMGPKFNYIITNLDFHTLDLEQYRYSATNLTGMRIVSPNNPLVAEAVEQWDSAAAMTGTTSALAVGNLRLDMALMWDAVQLFSRALERLDKSRDVNITNLDCKGETNWEHGFSLINFMRTTEMQGLTGMLKFDNQGFRTDYSVDIVEVSPEGDATLSIGNVDMNSFNLSRVEKAKEDMRKEMETVQNKTFRVMIAISEPYNMLKDSASTLMGNDRYEGFCIDLIKELSNNLGFNYTFIQQPDNSYGTCNKTTEQCTGMLAAVQKGDAELAITDLTITFDRATGVDFTKPFMSLGIGLLHTKPMKMQPSLFSFLDPFSSEVWLYLFVAYCLVSVELYVIARLTPTEWTNPYPCIEEPEELENQFSMMNAFWFTIGALMQQGTEIAPIAPSTRMVAGMWWFFTLIMVSSYTANLAAFLTVEPTEELISDPKQLADHPRIKYGAKTGGSTLNFFRDSTDPSYKKMYSKMDNMNDNEPGVNRVIDSMGDYAFFMESSSIEYQAQRKCEVRQVGQNLDQKGYGIAMKKNAPYLSALSAGVVKLQESGKLSELRTRWWEQRRGGGKCIGEASSEGGAAELGLPNVGGVFVVLGVGSTVAVTVALVELLWDLAMKAAKEKVSFKEELWDEIKFILKCKGSTKPIRKAKSEEDTLEDGQQGSKDLEPLTQAGENFALGSNGEDMNGQIARHDSNKEPLY